MNIRLLVVICVLAATDTACGTEVLSADVKLVEGRYEVDFAVLLDGDVEQAWDIITDYPRFAKISPTVKSSRLIGGGNGRDARIEVVLRPCALMIFCKTMTKTSDIRAAPDHLRLRYTGVPGAGDFLEAVETVELRDESETDMPRVRFAYTATLKPAFFVPPFVGPWLIKRAIVRNLEISGQRVERMLRDGPDD